MKLPKPYLLFLIFYLIVCKSSTIYAQEAKLKLIIVSEDETKQELIDRYNFKSEFETAKNLENYTTQVIDLLKKEGFLFVKVTSFEKIKENEFQLKLDLHQLYNGLKIKYDPSRLEKTIALPNNKTEDEFLYLSFLEYEVFANELIRKLNEQGKPFDQVQLVNLIEIENGLIEAELKFISKQQRNIDKIIVRGYERFPKQFIRNKIGLREKQIFNTKAIQKKNRNFENLAFASSIKEPEVQFTQDSTKVFLYVEKTNANVFDGFIGFNSTEETSIEFNGYVDLALVNNLHLGETLNINYKNDGREQQQFNATVELPYLFKTPLSFEAGLGIFRKDSTFSNTTQNIGLNYQLSPTIKVGGHAEFTNSSILLNTNLNPLETGSDFNSSFYGIKASFFELSRITGKFYNQKQIQVSVLTGSREAEIENTQLKINLFSEYSLPIVQSLFLYSSITAAWLSSENYIDNELFRFGGMNSMRGFEENSLVASTFGSLRTELRYFLSPILYANSVLDYGYLENDITLQAQNLFSFGFGLGIETQAGVLRLIFANGTSKTQEFSFENTQVHLSLNTFF